MYKILFFMISILISQTQTFEDGLSYYKNRSEGSNGLIPTDDNRKVMELIQNKIPTNKSKLLSKTTTP